MDEELITCIDVVSQYTQFGLIPVHLLSGDVSCKLLYNIHGIAVHNTVIERALFNVKADHVSWKLLSFLLL